MNFNSEQLEGTEQSSDKVLVALRRSIYPKRLNNIQESVFVKCWAGLTYQAIADELGYDPIYIRSIGSQVWKLLSQTFGERVSKSNFQAILNDWMASQPDVGNPEFPQFQGTVQLRTDGTPVFSQENGFYVERSPFEERCYGTVLQKGALIRIKAPRQMGKTSLMTRVLNYAQQHEHQTVVVSLRLADKEVFSNLERFLQWFCAIVCDQLNLDIDLEKEWKPIFGSNYNCTHFFGRTLLPTLEQPLVLALDDVDVLFDYAAIATDFLGLLRAWCEKAKHSSSDRDPWKQLKLLVIHSTEIYIPIHQNQSPFNIGLSIELPEFTLDEVQKLAAKYQLSWTQEHIRSLMNLVGGKPDLIYLTLEWISTQKEDLYHILQKSTSTQGIYYEHLRQQFRLIQKYPDLLPLFTQVMTEQEAQRLNAMEGFRLESLGLVKLSGQLASPSCQLYRNYFSPLLRERKS